MHKVIQVPLTLPDPRPDALLELLGDEIDTLIDQNRDDFSQERLWRVTNSLIVPQIHTMRDARRLQNVFRFQTRILGENLNSVDILGLSALIAFDPLMYEWIKRNKQLLLAPHFDEKPSDRKDAISLSLRPLGYSEIDAEHAQETLRCLFPSIKDLSSIDKHTAWRERRVCHSDLFDLYFVSGTTGLLPQRSVSDALYDEDTDSLDQAADLAISTGSFDAYLEEINSRLNGVKEDFAAKLATLLLSKLGADPSLFAERGFLTPSLNQKIGFMMRNLLLKIGKEKSYDVLSNAISKMDVNALASFAPELNSEELAHGRLAAESEKQDKQCLTSTDLETIEKIFLTRIEELSYRSEFASSANLAMLIYLWLCYDEAGCKSYWNHTFDEDPLAVCHFIATNAGRWSSSDGHFGWTFSEGIMEPILPRERALKKIEKLRTANALTDLDEDTLLKTIIYTLDGYNGLRTEKTSVAKAREMIPSWMH